MATPLPDSRTKEPCDICELLHFALSERATDIHFEPGPDGGQVRFRVDRFFRTIRSVDAATFSRQIGRIRVLAHLPGYESFKPQEGRISSEESGIDADVRVSIIPSAGGEKAVLRLLTLQKSITPLRDLGFSEACFEGLLQVSRRQSGMVLFCGPSGSGKTTTLYSLIQHLMQIRKNEWQFVSVEDPVERRIPGMTQLEIRPQFDLTFPSALKYLLRQDPEVIVVGEIRDAETAAVAVQAAFTGHLVLSTMHTAFAPETILRLERMGIPEYQILSAVNLVFTQRLIRKKCGKCEDGCEACGRTGYSGLIPVGECTDPRDIIGTRILGRESAAQRLRSEAQELIKLGLTTYDEVNRVFE